MGKYGYLKKLIYPSYWLIILLFSPVLSRAAPGAMPFATPYKNTKFQSIFWYKLYGK